jgi:hypothetical protein
VLKQKHSANLRRVIAENGLDETDPKSLEALWPHLSEIIREACKIEAALRGGTPERWGAKAVQDLLKHYDAGSQDES